MADLSSQPNILKQLLNVAGGILQVLESKGEVNCISCLNNSGSTVYLQFFAGTSEPIDTDVPNRAPIPIAAAGYYESTARRAFAAGTFIAISSTAGTLTAAGTNVWLDVQGQYA